MKNSIILCLSIITLMFSCSKEAMIKADIRSLKTHGYFPLHVGNEWDYEDGSLVRTDAREFIDGKEYFRFVKSKDSRLDTIYYREEGDKILEKKRRESEILRFDLKADRNDSWTFKKNSDASSQYVAMLRGQNARVETENFEFTNCFEFYYNSPQLGDAELEIFLAKGIGIVAKRGAWRATGLDPALKRINIGGTEVIF